MENKDRYLAAIKKAFEEYDKEQRSEKEKFFEDVFPTVEEKILKYMADTGSNMISKDTGSLIIFPHLKRKERKACRKHKEDIREYFCNMFNAKNKHISVWFNMYEEMEIVITKKAYGDVLNEIKDQR